MFFPMVVASCTDSAVALGRIGKFLTSEELEEPYTIAPESKLAIDAEGDFTWETAHKPPPEKLPDFTKPQGKHGPSRPPPEKKDKKNKGEKAKKAGKRRGWFGRKEKGGPVLPTDASTADEKGGKDKKDETEKPFELKNLNFKVPRGSFAVILGPIGSGKVGHTCWSAVPSCSPHTAPQSSLMQALVGEMRRTRGHVRRSGAAVQAFADSSLPDRPFLVSRLCAAERLDHERYAPREHRLRTRGRGREAGVCALISSRDSDEHVKIPLHCEGMLSRT